MVNYSNFAIAFTTFFFLICIMLAGSPFLALSLACFVAPVLVVWMAISVLKQKAEVPNLPENGDLVYLDMP